MVLAAGAGRRLRPDTDRLPKALLPVDGDVTILDIVLRNLASAGLREAVVVVGYGAVMVADQVERMQGETGLAIELVHNPRAEEWNNAYSLWLGREYFRRGVLLVNGDTVHPVSVEKALLAAGTDLADTDEPLFGRLILAIDDLKVLAEEEMKVTFDASGRLTRITKRMDPSDARGEYIGAALIGSEAAATLADALEATWRRDPALYYEDSFTDFTERGGEVRGAPIGAVEWVEVDNHQDLRRAREIAPRC